jgi:outer membrane protein assembly factor BamA
MMGRSLKILLVLVAMLAVSCSVTRSLPEGEYLLSAVKIKSDKTQPHDDRITADKDGLDIYVRQSPNKRILGIDFYVWVYQMANPEKKNWWNNFKRKIGEEPVLLDSALTEKSVQNLKTYLDTRGYFSSEVTYEVDTVERKRRASVTYTLYQGKPTRIRNISYEFRDSSLRTIVLADTARMLLHRGDILDIADLDEERMRITSVLNNSGYFNFTVNNISYDVDTLMGNYTADVRMVIRPTLVGYNEQGAPIWENNAIYRLRNINVYPTYDPMRRESSGFKEGAEIDTSYYYGLNIIRDENATPRLRNSVLRRRIPLYPNYIYDAEQVSHTYSELMSLGFFRTAKISFEHVPEMRERMSYLGLKGHNVCSLQDVEERYLDCNIYCAPALNQSLKVEVEASTTSTFYGLGVTLGYTNTNIFRGAEAFDIAARFGFEYMYAPDAAKRSAQEVGVSVGLAFPRFLLPFRLSSKSRVLQPRSRLELSFDFQNRPYYRRNLSSARWAYSWKYGKYSSFVVRPIDINWIDVKSVDENFLNDIDNQYLKTSFESQLNAGLFASYVYNNQTSDLRNVSMVRLNVETSGNLIQGLNSLFSHHASGKDYYEILGVRYSQYVRAEANISHKIDLGHKMALAGRLFGGVGVTYGNSRDRSIPFDRMFYCGGANSMRGWVPRTLGPGNKAEVLGSVYPAQVGDVRLEANLEFRFPVWSIFHGAIFLDAGNVWYLRNSESNSADEVFHWDRFYKQLGLNTGIGLRIDVKFVVVRLDLGMQLHNPGRPVGERWINNLRWSNMAINFGVGYPF